MGSSGRPRRAGPCGRACITTTARPLRSASPPAIPFPLRFTDFDVLDHVNNAVYWEAVEEELARRRELRAPLRAELEHRAPIEPGAEVEVVIEETATELGAVAARGRRWIGLRLGDDRAALKRPAALADHVLQMAVDRAGLGLAGEAEVLQVGVGLAVGHRALGAR